MMLCAATMFEICNVQLSQSENKCLSKTSYRNVISVMVQSTEKQVPYVWHFDTKQINIDVVLWQLTADLGRIPR